MNRKIHCYTHNDKCDVSPVMSHARFTVHCDVSGSVCSPGNKMGHMLGFCCTTSCRIFCIYLMDLILGSPTFVLHECTFRFYWKIFVKHIPDYEWESIVGDTVRRGLPVTRIHRLTLVNTGVARMVRPFSDVSMLHRNVEMDGDSYFTEPGCDILQ
jgi:hypothetical protein